MKPHYRPMLAQTADVPFNSKDWLFEIKWDGFRAISYVDGKLNIKSRNNRELITNFPELEELKNMIRDAVLDGEIVVMRRGRPDFQTLLERSKTTSPTEIELMSHKYPVTYIVFDILEKDGKTLIDFPLVERKRILKGSLVEGKHVVISQFIEEEGMAYYQASIRRSLEGIMAKRKDSPYSPGSRSGNWLKIKKVRSCDCVIFGYTLGEGSRKETFGALILGLYTDGKPVYIGKVGTGFSQSDTELLKKAFKGLRVREETLHGVNLPQEIVWLKPVLVCEITYQTITKEDKLRMPRFWGLRADKTPPECTLDQLRHR